MLLWQIFVIAGGIFLIIEMLAPMMFFLNFAIGAFITALVSVYFPSWSILILTFTVSSVMLLLLFRPFLTKYTLVNNKDSETGITGQYIGQKAKVISPITVNSGVVTIYGERWEARLENNSLVTEIPVGEETKIVKNESLILYVEKILKEKE